MSIVIQRYLIRGKHLSEDLDRLFKSIKYILNRQFSFWVPRTGMSLQAGKHFFDPVFLFKAGCCENKIFLTGFSTQWIDVEILLQTVQLLQ